MSWTWDTLFPAPAPNISGFLSGGKLIPSIIPTSLSRGVNTQPEGQIYNATGSSLRAWRAALAGTDESAGGNADPNYRAARLLMVGDSNTQGAGINNWARSYPMRLRKLIAAKYPDAGSGIIHLLPAEQFQTNGSNAVDNRINFIGTWSSDSRGAFGAGARRANGAGNTMVYTDTMTSFVLYYITGTDGGTFSVSVDGGTAVTVNSNGSDGLAQYAVTGLALGTHVVTVTAPTADNAILHGIEGRNDRIPTNNKGIRVTKAGLTGATVQTLLQSGSTTGSSSLATIFDTCRPDLTILGMEENDYLNSHIPVATYKSRMSTVIDYAKTYGSVLLVACIPPQDTASTPSLSAYTQILYELADEKDCALIDMQARWGTYAISQPLGMYRDAFHGSERGYWDMAKIAFDAIIPKSGNPDATFAVTNAAQTFVGLQTFADGIGIAAGKTLAIGDVVLSRDSGFSLTVNAQVKSSKFFTTGATNLGVINARAATGARALSAQGTDGTERGGFSINGRLMSIAGDRQQTVGAAGTASALPLQPTTYMKVEDGAGTVYVVPLYAS